jgi:hypothetical protein
LRVRVSLNLMRSQGMTDTEDFRDLVTRLNTALESYVVCLQSKTNCLIHALPRVCGRVVRSRAFRGLIEPASMEA